MNEKERKSGKNQFDKFRLNGNQEIDQTSILTATSLRDCLHNFRRMDVNLINNFLVKNYI